MLGIMRERGWVYFIVKEACVRSCRSAQQWEGANHLRSRGRVLHGEEIASTQIQGGSGPGTWPVTKLNSVPGRKGCLEERGIWTEVGERKSGPDDAVGPACHRRSQDWTEYTVSLEECVKKCQGADLCHWGIGTKWEPENPVSMLFDWLWLRGG